MDTKSTTAPPRTRKPSRTPEQCLQEQIEYTTYSVALGTALLTELRALQGKPCATIEAMKDAMSVALVRAHGMVRS